MGQQQLLLLVLGIVIVGIAAVAGIQAFSEGKSNAKADATVADASRVTTDLQAWFFKPKPFGGGGEDSTSFAGAKWSTIGRDAGNDALPSVTDTYDTANACMKMTPAATSVKIEVYKRTKTACEAGVFAEAVVASGDEDGIVWTYK